MSHVHEHTAGRTQSAGFWSLPHCPRGKLWPRPQLRPQRDSRGCQRLRSCLQKHLKSVSPADTGALYGLKLAQAARVRGGREAPSRTREAALGGSPGSGEACVSDPPQRARAGPAPGLAAWEITTALRRRDTISVWFFGFQAQELWDVMEICKSANQTANFKEGKEGLAGRD